MIIFHFANHEKPINISKQLGVINTIPIEDRIREKICLKNCVVMLYVF